MIFLIVLLFSTIISHLSLHYPIRLTNLRHGSSYHSIFSKLSLSTTETQEFIEIVDEIQYKIESKNKLIHKISFDVAGKPFSFETGKIGRQAGGAVVGRINDTIVYSTVCADRNIMSVEFAPLKVDFFARYSAVGQTVGAFHRRDSRGDDNEILVARLIDRPLRPMLHDGWQHDTQVLAWVLSYDKIQSYEPLAICTASAAMAISEVPYSKAIAGVEVGIIDGEIVVNPTKQQVTNSSLQITMAGTKDGILMIEGFAQFIPEETFMNAMTKGHEAIRTICNGIDVFQRIAGSNDIYMIIHDYFNYLHLMKGRPKKIETLRLTPDGLLDNMDELYGKRLEEALSISDKQDRGAAVSLIESEVMSQFATIMSTLNSCHALLYMILIVYCIVGTPRSPLNKAIQGSDDIIQEDIVGVVSDESNGDIVPDTIDDEIVITDESILIEDEASELPTLEGIDCNLDICRH